MVFEKNEVSILRRAERSMVSAMCGVKLVYKKSRGAHGDVGIEGSSR